MSVSSRRQREREKRQDLILSAAERIFHNKGLDLATMEDVADEAQLGKGTLYLYFRNKEELLMGLVARRQRKLIARYELVSAAAHEAGIDMVRALLVAYGEHMATPIQHLKMALSRWASGVPLNVDNPGGAQLHEHALKLFGTLAAAIEGGQTDGSIRADFDAKRLAVQLWSSVNGALLLRLQHACMPAQQPLMPAVPKLSDMVDLMLDAVRPRQAAQENAS